MLVDRLMGIGIGMTATGALVAVYMELKDEVDTYVGMQASIVNSIKNGNEIDIDSLIKDIDIHTLTDEQVIELVYRFEDLGLLGTCEKETQ